jgi:5-formyltetrahydrofolate cyclo-ligase
MPTTEKSGNLPEDGTPEFYKKLSAWRKLQRVELLRARTALTPADHQLLNQQILGILCSSCFEDIFKGIVGVFWPIRGEVDLRPFIDVIMKRGSLAAMPVVIAPKHPLEFRIWKPGDPMEMGAYAIPYPTEGDAVAPDVLLAPLVGFDTGCYRMGYGGGFYDRTLAALPNKPITVGVGFEIGRLETIRPQKYDIPLDYIVTESNFLSLKEIASHAAVEEITTTK